MKTELIDVSPTRKEIKIEIEADAVRDAYDRVSDRYAQLAAVPGFRKGRAPRSVVRTRFKDEIRIEVLRELVPQAITDAISEHELEVIGEPDVHLDGAEETNKIGEQPISVHAHVEVLPAVALGEYKGLEVARRVRPVTDEDVDRVVEGLREASAALQPVEDRPSQLDDTVTVNVHGKFIGNPEQPEQEDINVDDIDIVLGGPGVQQEFTDNLLGVKVDDVKNFTVNYPEDFTSRGLAGKRVEYAATVTAVRRKELPELDDEWAKSLGEELDSITALREKVREDLLLRTNEESDNRVRSEVMRKLVESHPFEVPQTLVAHQANSRLESVVRDMMERGIDPRQQEVNWEGLRGSLMSQAEFDVRGSMLLERVADQENVTVTDEDIEAEINALAASSRQAPEQVRAALTKQGGERSIADRLRNRKALDLLVENARVTEEEWREEALEEGESVSPQEAATSDTPKDQLDEETDAARAQEEQQQQSSSREA